MLKLRVVEKTGNFVSSLETTSFSATLVVVASEVSFIHTKNQTRYSTSRNGSPSQHASPTVYKQTRQITAQDTELGRR